LLQTLKCSCHFSLFVKLFFQNIKSDKQQPNICQPSSLTQRQLYCQNIHVLVFSFQSIQQHFVFVGLGLVVPTFLPETNNPTMLFRQNQRFSNTHQAFSITGNPQLLVSTTAHRLNTNDACPTSSAAPSPSFPSTEDACPTRVGRPLLFLPQMRTPTKHLNHLNTDAFSFTDNDLGNSNT